MSQLTNYIQKELDRGFSKDIITKKLLQAGYTKEEITQSFKSLKSAEPILRRKFADTLHLETHIQWSKWIFGLLAVAVVVIFGFLVYQYREELPSLPVSEVEETACDELLDVEEKDRCYLELAATGEEVCDKLSTDVLRTICSQKMWEVDKCNFDFLMTKDTDSREQCLWEKAIESKDASYCTKKVHDKIECLLQLVHETKDATLCGVYYSCYQSYALQSKDITVCDLIDIEYEKHYCKQYYSNTINS